MDEQIITDENNNKEYESLNFPIIPEENNFINQNKGNNSSLVDKIVSVFDIPSIEKKKQYLKTAKEKIRQVVKSIKDLRVKNEEKYRPRNYILDPDSSKIRFFLDGFIVMLIFMDLVISPFEYFVYQIPEFKNFREIVFDLFFLFEIIANFFTGYYDKITNQLVSQPKEIALNYLRKGLIFDIIYTLPLWMFYYKLMILRLVKIYRYPYIISIIQKLILTFSSYCNTNFKIKKIMIEFVSFGFNVFYILHIFACIYVFIGKSYDSNWIKEHKINIDSVLEVYISSVYLLTQTFSTTGYGDMTPVNNVEMCFVMVSQIICCGLFSYYITCILIIFTDHVDTLIFKYQTTIELSAWMAKFTSHLPSTTNTFEMTETLWEDVTKYFTLYYGTRSNFTWINRFPFLQELKPHDKNKLLEKAFQGIINQFSRFFQEMNHNSRYQIILKLKTHIQKSNYLFIKEGHQIKRLFFIARGSVYILKEKTVVCQLKEGHTFGLLGLFDPVSSYSYETYPNEYALVYSIALTDLYKILLYDEKSFRSLIKEAIEAKLALNKMRDKSISLSHIIDDENSESFEKSIEKLPQINLNNDPNVVISDELKEEESKQLNIKEIIKDDPVAIALNAIKEREKECIELELRLRLIENQILYLNKAIHNNILI